MRTVFLEKNEATNEFVTVNTYTAWEGFHLLGYHCQPFTYKQMDFLDLNKETVVNGWIRSVNKAFQIIGATEPVEISIPDELMSFAGRKIWTSTLEEIRKYEPRVFIKPLEGHKLFNGHIRTGEMKDLIYTSMYPDETKILVSEVVDFVSEYRGFVLEGKLIGLKHYRGDYTKIVDAKIIESAITEYKSAPVAYSIDFGLTDDNRCLLVEVNDAFSLGCYGLDPVWYARMIEARWDQIVNP
jgi:hypothetical protein